VAAAQSAVEPTPTEPDAGCLPTPRPERAPTRSAVVIAAGAGRRLRATSGDDEVVKPLTRVLGIPLIVRTLLTLRDEGVESAVVVTGYEAAEVRSLLEGDARLAPLSLRFVHNPDWRKRNGLSVLAARAAIDGGAFVLSMADHLYAADLVRTLQRASRARRELLLGVDRRVGAVPDAEDATWVRLDPAGRILDIGKRIEVYNAVDTGVFVADGSLFDALEDESRARGGDCALADGVRRLAGEGLARGVDIGEAWWHDVDTRADLLRAEQRLRTSAHSGRPRLPRLRRLAPRSG
jgi:1L-myo-inositol 1-phosphate cytidylyltransferase